MSRNRQKSDGFGSSALHKYLTGKGSFSCMNALVYDQILLMHVALRAEGTRVLLNKEWAYIYIIYI